MILSIFPGIDLLGKGFELEGFCVVRGPDLIFGGDVREFSPPSGVFSGVIGGPPCQDFSNGRRCEPTGYGLKMLREYKRIVVEASPQWWLMENVPAVPDLHIEGYSWQRLDLRASEFGLRQSRLRHFQFGHREGWTLIVEREKRVKGKLEPCCLASRNGGRDWSRFCQLQGLPPDYQLPAFTEGARYRAVGNGVPLPMAKAVARAIKDMPYQGVRACVCGCGRAVTGKAKSAGPACRKRLERRRKKDNEK